MSARSAVWDADRDMLRHNPVHAAEREEHLGAVAAMSELERAAGPCRHGRSRGVCPDCGDNIRGEL